MAAQAGKDMLLKIEGAPGVFTTVAGLGVWWRRRLAAVFRFPGEA